MVPTGDGRDEALILQAEHDGEVELCEGDGGDSETCLGGVLQVRADVGQVEEDHGGRGLGGGVDKSKSGC